MTRTHRITLLLAVVVGLAGCAEEATSPLAAAGPESEVAPRTSAAAAPALTSPDITRPAHDLVVFAGAHVPKGFAERVAALGGTVERTFDAVGAASVSGLTDTAIVELAATRGVRWVEPEVLFDPPRPVVAPHVADGAAVPIDPDAPGTAEVFPAQWHLRTIGVDAARAAGHQGAADVTVAILDTGIGYTHADLEGLVDLERSVSFAPVDDHRVAVEFPGARPIADLSGHGTLVASIVASNGVVAAGVTSRTTLMGVKVCSAVLDACPAAAVFAGILYAVENGADIINMSLGGAVAKRDVPGFKSIVGRIFNYAKRNDVLIVVAAGNEHADLNRNLVPTEEGDTLHIPSLFATYCDAPNVICVSATGPTASESEVGPWQDIDASAFYTNFGRSAISVAAPGGGNGGGLVWGACSPFSLADPTCRAADLPAVAAGTSMAAPHVTGLAALLRAEHDWNPAQLRHAIESTATDLGKPGADAFYGRGRIDVAAAVGVF